MSERHVTVDTVIQAVCAVCGCTRLDILSDRRPETLNSARYAIYWLAKQLTTLSIATIARTVGGRDHSTVLYGLERAEELRRDDLHFRNVTDALLGTLTAVGRTGVLRLAAVADPLATARRVLAAPEREAVRVPVIEIVALCQLVVETFGKDDAPLPDPFNPPSTATQEITDAA
jgi:hypothetical protein